MPNGTSITEWDGSVFIWHRRILFAGEAGTSRDQTVHAIKICIAFSGEFVLKIGSETEGKRYSAAIINTGVKHTMECDREEVLLLYLLPETEEAKMVKHAFLDGRPKVCRITKDSVEKLLPSQRVRKNYLKWKCEDALESCNGIIRGLGSIGREGQLPSTNLSRKELNLPVRGAVEHIYAEIGVQSRNPKGFDRERFEPSVIADLLGVKESVLKSDFGKQVGCTIGRFFNDIQLLAILEQYAVKDSERQLRKIAKQIHLKEIAKSFGFLTHASFSSRVRSRLGISLADLKGRSRFLACEDVAAKR